MASPTREETPSSTVAANAPAELLEAKLMVATRRGDCQRLKDVLNKEDASTMVVVMATRKQDSPKPALASMNPELLAAASEGNLGELNLFLNRNRTQGSVAILRSPDDVEEGVNMPAESRSSLLGGATVEGDTVLHVVAANGDDTNFLHCASFIMDLAGPLLFAPNYNGDTPLHCAARAKKSKMVTHLIGRLATSQNNEIVKDLLRIENHRKETVLHDAVRNGDNDLVEQLLIEDSELARFPEKGSTPMYLATVLDMGIIAQTLHDKSLTNDLCYYSGPNGQNALHAAVLRSQVLTKKLLRWNNDLAAQRDENGSTPLHFAAASQQRWKAGSACRQVFEAYPAALYQADIDGLYPIHVAASSDARFNITMFVGKCPRSAGLRDAKGRTFLHVAVEKNIVRTVHHACDRNRLFAWILNMQDREGNTALHLAVKDGDISMFRALIGNKHVNLNLTNAEERTPRDIAEYNISPSFQDMSDPESLIKQVLSLVNAARGVSRQDHFDENYDNVHGVKSDYKTKEVEMLKDSTQVQSIGSVLIATVTFGAMFALPGGYRADDHDYGGTPTLAGTYAFDAFMIANTLAFISSTVATLGFIYAGSAKISLVRRKRHFTVATDFLESSIMTLTTAFALGVYTVLSPVAQKTAILISVMSPSVVLYYYGDFWLSRILFARAFSVRKGPIWALVASIIIVLSNIFAVSGLFIIIFVWAAYGRNHPISNSVSPAQAPTHLS